MPQSPSRVEVTPEAVTFEHKGVTYTVPPAAEWDVDALEAFEDEKVTAFLRAVVGPASWAEFKATKPKVRDLRELADALLEAASLGN